MPAIPLIGLGISGITSAIGAHNSSKVAGAQQDLMGKQSALAQEMQGFAKDQYAAGAPALNKAMEYYTKLATGNRGDIQSTLAPGIAQLNETYNGAQRGIESKLAPGPGRDQQIAQLYRQRAGQIGLMPSQARASAVGEMANLGQNRMNSAQDYFGKAGSALSGASSTGVNYGNAQNNASNRWGTTVGNGAQGVLDWYNNRQKPDAGYFTPYGPGY